MTENEITEIDISSKPSVNFGGGIELLMNDKIKEKTKEDSNSIKLDTIDSLDKENRDIIEWLLSNSSIKENELEVLKSANSRDNNISILDENNQKLRRILTDEVEFLESDGQRAKVLSAYELFRSMHQRRKVSDLVGLLQQNTD